MTYRAFTIFPNKLFSFLPCIDLSDHNENDANLLQVDTADDLNDATTLVFPAIGAALMLLFGGLLLTTATRCGLKDSESGDLERTGKRFSRKISFYNVPDQLHCGATSVLQQEDNDIVDAVVKQCDYLKQYQPSYDHIDNCNKSHATILSRPKMVDKGLSPIHETKFDYELSGRVNAGSGLQFHGKGTGSAEFYQEDVVNKRNGERGTSQQENELKLFNSSDIDTRSLFSFDSDSLEQLSLHQDKTERNAEPSGGKNSDSGTSTELSSLICSKDQFVVKGGRRSVVRSQRAPRPRCIRGCVCSVHQGKSRRPHGERRRAGYGLTTPKATDSESGPENSFSSETVLSDFTSDSTAKKSLLQAPTADNSLTTENMKRRSQSPLRKAALERWLADVQEFYPRSSSVLKRKKFETDNTESNHSDSVGLKQKCWRKTSREKQTSRRQPITRRVRRTRLDKDSLGLLKKLPISPDSSLENDRDMEEPRLQIGGPTSLSRTVRAPNSFCTINTCCSSHTRHHNPCVSGEATDDCQTAELLLRQEVDKKPNVTKGGRLSLLKVVRAPSALCINGPQCGTHYKPAISFSDKSKSDNERGASSLGGLQKHLAQQAGGASSLGGARILGRPESNDCDLRGARSLGDQKFRSMTDNNDAELRGASVFGGSQTIGHRQEPSVLGLREIERKPSEEKGVISLAQDPLQSELHTSEIRGASSCVCLEELTGECGTSSITLSIAQNSDRENLHCETDSLKSKHSHESKGGTSIKSSNTIIAPKTLHTRLKEPTHFWKGDQLPSGLANTSDYCTHNEARHIDEVSTSMTWSVHGNSARRVEVQQRACNLQDAAARGKIETCIGISSAEKTKVARSASKLSRDNILNVGKDASLMSAVLHALRQQGYSCQDRRKA